MRRKYPSDISQEQFEEIREELAGAKKTTYPRKYDLYDIFCAVLYLLKEGCTWRAVLHDFLKWRNVRYHLIAVAKSRHIEKRFRGLAPQKHHKPDKNSFKLSEVSLQRKTASLNYFVKTGSIVTIFLCLIMLRQRKGLNHLSLPIK